MTLRITLAEDHPPTRTIRLEGRLTAEELPELGRTLEDASGSLPLRIDVTHLLSADAEGLLALNRLRDTGAEIEGASPYLRLLLGDPVE